MVVPALEVLVRSASTRGNTRSDHFILLVSALKGALVPLQQLSVHNVPFELDARLMLEICMKLQRH